MRLTYRELKEMVREAGRTPPPRRGSSLGRVQTQKPKAIQAQASVSPSAIQIGMQVDDETAQSWAAQAQGTSFSGTQVKGVVSVENGVLRIMLRK